MSNRFFRITLSIALPLVAIGAAAKPKLQTKPSRYIYVWSGNAMKDKKGMDMVAVIDADPSAASAVNQSNNR